MIILTPSWKYGGVIIEQKDTENPGTTMEEYVQFETERDLRNGEIYNWETAKYESKFSSKPELKSELVNLENETSLPECNYEKYNSKAERKSLKKRFFEKEKFSILDIDEDLFSYKIPSANNLQLDEGNDDYKIDIKQFSGDIFDTYVDENGKTNMALPPRNERHLWLSYAWRALLGIRGPLIQEICFGEEEGARMSGGYFIARLGVHSGVITEESLQTLTVEVRGLTTIDIEELIRLWIFERLGDVVTWVALGLERQQVGAAARAANVDPEAAQEGVQADLALRLEEEVYRLRESLGEQRVLLERMSSDQARFSSWMFDRMTQLMGQSGLRHPRFDGSILGSSQVGLMESGNDVKIETDTIMK
ncbi:hypothetical protein Tco_0701974 [Tanacetum coccineum]|uniref:Uncharacterized protein n=1 Tax=Tanacetum coccineum TaxID=301880 RepID=A0ABQ4XUP4_9ASTR